MRSSPSVHSQSENVVLSSGGSTILRMDIYKSPGTVVDNDFAVLDLLLFVSLRATSCQVKALGAGRWTMLSWALLMLVWPIPTSRRHTDNLPAH